MCSELEVVVKGWLLAVVLSEELVPHVRRSARQKKLSFVCVEKPERGLNQSALATHLLTLGEQFRREGRNVHRVGFAIKLAATCEFHDEFTSYGCP